MATAQTICFQRNDAVWLADSEGGNQRCVISATTVEKLNACEFRIAPDGSSISFTHFYMPPGKFPAYHDTSRYRGIALFDVKTSQVTFLDNVPMLNDYNAVWSSDASSLAFTYPHDAPLSGVSTSVAIIKKDNTGFNIITDALGPKEYDIYFYAWSSDGSTVLCYTGDSLYSMAHDGHLLSTEPFIFPDSMEVVSSSSTNMTVSPDGRYIALDPETSDDGYIHFKNYWVVGLYGAIWLFDRQQRTFTRITPKNLSASDPAWSAQGNEVWFCGIPGDSPKHHKSNIYRTDMKGHNITMVVKDASSMSMSSH